MIRSRKNFRRFSEAAGSEVVLQFTPTFFCKYDSRHTSTCVSEAAKSNAYEMIEIRLNIKYKNGWKLLDEVPSNLEGILTNAEISVDKETKCLFVFCNLSCGATPEIVKTVKNYISDRLRLNLGKIFENDIIATTVIYTGYVNNKAVFVKGTRKEALAALEDYKAKHPEIGEDDYTFDIPEEDLTTDLDDDEDPDDIVDDYIKDVVAAPGVEKDNAPVYCSFAHGTLHCVSVDGAPFRESHRIQHRNYIR